MAAADSNTEKLKALKLKTKSKAKKRGHDSDAENDRAPPKETYVSSEFPSQVIIPAINKKTVSTPITRKSHGKLPLRSNRSVATAAVVVAAMEAAAMKHIQLQLPLS